MSESKESQKELKALHTKNLEEAKQFEKYKTRLEGVLKDFNNCRVGKDISKRKKTTLFGVFSF